MRFFALSNPLVPTGLSFEFQSLVILRKEACLGCCLKLAREVGSKVVILRCIKTSFKRQGGKSITPRNKLCARLFINMLRMGTDRSPLFSVEPGIRVLMASNGWSFLNLYQCWCGRTGAVMWEVWSTPTCRISFCFLLFNVEIYQ